MFYVYIEYFKYHHLFRVGGNKNKRVSSSTQIHTFRHHMDTLRFFEDDCGEELAPIVTHFHRFPSYFSNVLEEKIRLPKKLIVTENRFVIVLDKAAKLRILVFRKGI